VRSLIVPAIEKLATRKASFGAGAAGATFFLKSFFGISLVAHSSGGAILTAGSGYIAGTFISAFVVALFPLVVLAGIIIIFRRKLVQFFDWGLERIYFWRKRHK